MAQIATAPTRHEISQTRLESDRARRVLNLRLLLVSVAIGSALSLAGYGWYRYRYGQVAKAMVQRAAGLEKDGEWQKSAGYLNRYLQLRPDDLDARLRLVEAVEHSAQTDQQRKYLLGLLYQTLGLVPDRHDLRLKLANQLLASQDFAGAETAASKVETESPKEEDKRAARRIIALSLLARARVGGPISIKVAADKLIGALAENPGDVELASQTAVLYRTHPQDVGTTDAALKADSIMNSLVQANSGKTDALIARYMYRRRFGQAANARQDLDKVLLRDPDNVETLLLLANEDIQTGGEQNLSAGEQKLLKVSKLQPNDPRGPSGLARVYAAKGDPERTVDVLMKAHTHVEKSSFEDVSLLGVDALLIDTLINLNRLDDAEPVLKDFDEKVREQLQLPDVPTDRRIMLENMSRLLRGRFDIGRNNLDQATRELSAVVSSVGEADIAAGATNHEQTDSRLAMFLNYRIQAHSLLAFVMAKLGRFDLAAPHWRTAADLAPNFLDARLKAAAAYLDLGRPGEAIRQLELYVESPSATEEGWILLVQAHLQQQLTLPSNERNWSEFSDVLDQAKKKMSKRWEPQIAEVLYWHALGTEEYNKLAMHQLQKLAKAHPTDSGLLGRVALCFQQLGASADANRVLDLFEKAESNPVRRALVHAALRVQQGQADEASKTLAHLADELSGPERRELQLARAKLLVATGQLDAAQQVAKALIADSPHDPASFLLAIDIALTRQDMTLAARMENDLRDLGTGDDFDLQFCRVRRLLGQFAKLDAPGRAELESLVNGLQSNRPDWYPVAALAGQYAELTGNRRKAIDAWRLAIDLGDRRPETFQRLIQALYADGRYSEASSILARLDADQPSDARIESLAIALAVKENRLSDALKMAKQAVDRGTKDPMRYVWLANLLVLNNQQKEAEGVFRDSIQRFPKEPSVWNAVFTYFVHSKQPDRARQALEQWSKNVPDKEPAKQFVLAQGYELLGDMAAAQEHYRATIASDSKNVRARLRFAKSLLSSDIAAARSEFEEVLKIDATNAEARRYVASLLAASGTDDDWDRAVRLLEAGQRSGGTDESVADDRLRAILLSRRGQNQSERLENCEAARHILMTRLGKSDNTGVDLDRMLIAGIYEKEGAIQGSLESVLAARDALRPLVDRENPPSEYLITYIQLMLRHLEHIGKVTEKSAEEEERRTVLISDTALRIDKLESALGANPAIESRYVPLAFRVRLFGVQGRDEEGRKQLSQFGHEQLASAANDADRAKHLLQLGNLASAAGYHQEAEEWYRQLLNISPNSYVLLAKSLSDQKKYKEAIDLCLRVAPKRPAGEVATLLTQLLTTAGNNKELEGRVQPTISAALNADRNNVELLMSVAVRHVTVDNYDEAIKLFRRVIELQPNHAVALNNLATLLAERPNELAEARKYAERAMASVGRTPPLLDTLGTIEIRSGNPERAVVDLEEAIAGAARDPRYYFHLAVAYQRSQRELDAQNALDTAYSYGLDSAILTAGDRELLTLLKQQLPTEPRKQK